MRDLHDRRHPVHHNDLVAPVELIGLARRERQRHKGIRRRACIQLRPASSITADGVIAAVVSERPQLLENPDQGQPLSRRRFDIRGQQPIELLLPPSELRARLHLTLVGKRCLVRAQDLTNRIAGQPQVACDLLDRLALDKILAPYSTDRLHNQHPPPPASCQSRQTNKSKIGGSILDADPPPQGVTFPRRITFMGDLSLRASIPDARRCRDDAQNNSCCRRDNQLCNAAAHAHMMATAQVPRGIDGVVIDVGEGFEGLVHEAHDQSRWKKKLMFGLSIRYQRSGCRR